MLNAIPQKHNPSTLEYQKNPLHLRSQEKSAQEV